MFLIFPELGVLSRSCINTNKCMSLSRLVDVQKENVMHSTEDEPQVSQTSHRDRRGCTNMGLRWFQQIPKAPGISSRVRPIPWKQNQPTQEKKKEKRKTGGNPESGFNQKLKTEHVSWKNAFPGNSPGRDSVPWEQNKLGGQVWPQVRQSICSDCCESLGLWRLSRTHGASQGDWGLQHKTHIPPTHTTYRRRSTLRPDARWKITCSETEPNIKVHLCSWKKKKKKSWAKYFWQKLFPESSGCGLWGAWISWILFRFQSHQANLWFCTLKNNKMTQKNFSIIDWWADYFLSWWFCLQITTTGPKARRKDLQGKREKALASTWINNLFHHFNWYWSSGLARSTDSKPHEYPSKCQTAPLKVWPTDWVDML